MSYSLRILQESLVGFLLSKVLEELLSVSEHRVHVSFVLHRQLQSPAERQALAADTQVCVWSGQCQRRHAPVPVVEVDVYLDGVVIEVGLQ